MFTIDDSKQTDRLTIYRLNLSDSLDSFTNDVFVGLTSNPKNLLPKYFYDDLGSRLFEAICFLPEYYVTRDENEIITENVNEVINEVGVSDRSSIRLVELGSGSADKTHHIIESLLQRNAELNYLPIDISPSSLERSSKELLLAFPQLRIIAYASDYSSALSALQNADSHDLQDNMRTIVLFLGSSIGNLDPAESQDLLRGVRGILRSGDVLLMGADLKKSADILIPAYDDALGVTAAFNLNLLVRINRELNGSFDLGKFEHRALYNEELGRVEMHLFSREAQIVPIRNLSLEVNFEGGESIHTENSYKYDLAALAELANKTGFYLKKTWFDANRRFSFNLFAATSLTA